MKKFSTLVAGKDNILPDEYLPGRYLKERHHQKSFYTYFQKENSIYNYLILTLVLAQFIFFKVFYPYPDFFSDSYSYLYAAYKNLDANIWPIGYSKFLVIFHYFTHSALALNFFQYLFLELSALFFYHTVVFFYPTGKSSRTILCLFLFFNPLFLYLANYVTSDALFIGLSLVWLAELIWIIQRPHPSQVLVQAALFAIAFTFRYNAMYYPLLAAAAFLFSNHKPLFKITGSLLGPLLMVFFILFSRQATYNMVGTAQFPPILGGWQWGNNALYIRDYIQLDTTHFPSTETAELDQIARTYFRRVPPEQRELSSYVANFFIRQPEAPLKTYVRDHYTITNAMTNVIAWGKAAPIFDQYGRYVIGQHPVAFLQHFILLNTKNYFLPPLEKLEVYNLGEDSVDLIASYWFHFPSERITTVFPKTLQGYVLFFFPSLFLLFNIYFFFELYLYIRLKIYKRVDKALSQTILLITGFVLLNFGFSVFANIIVIRYQVFPMIVCLSFAMLLTDCKENAKANADSPRAREPHLEKSKDLRPSL